MRFLLLAGFADSVVAFRGALIESLIDKGFEVHVAAPGAVPGSPKLKSLVDNGVVLHNVCIVRTGLNPFHDIRAFFSILGILIRVRPDVFLAYTIKPVVYGIVAATLARVPKRYALVTGLGYSFQEATGFLRGIARFFARLLYAISLRMATKTFFQNPDDQQLFRDRHIIGNLNCSVVVNGSGVNTSEFCFVPYSGAGISFLLVARLLGDKGVREYAQAALKLKDIYPQVSFRIVGWIDCNPNSIRQDELDDWVSGGIEFLGRLDDVRPAIANSSVYVLPSYREGTPRTVLEAMSIGRPIITTDAPGCRETVINGSNGYLVPVASVDALVDAMKAFIENPDLIFSMGKMSRIIAEEKYDVHKVNQVMLQEMGIL